MKLIHPQDITIKPYDSTNTQKDSYGKKVYRIRRSGATVSLKAQVNSVKGVEAQDMRAGRQIGQDKGPVTFHRDGQLGDTDRLVVTKIDSAGNLLRYTVHEPRRSCDGTEVGGALLAAYTKIQRPQVTPEVPVAEWTTVV